MISPQIQELVGLLEKSPDDFQEREIDQLRLAIKIWEMRPNPLLEYHYHDRIAGFRCSLVNWVGGQYWKGGQYLQLDKETGLLELGQIHERTDIIWVRAGEHLPVPMCLGVEGRAHIDGDVIKLGYSDDEILDCRLEARRIWLHEQEYVERQRQFLEQKPWVLLAGKTPAEALAMFDRMWWAGR